jgi:hypothetical protein
MWSEKTEGSSISAKPENTQPSNAANPTNTLATIETLILPPIKPTSCDEHKYLPPPPEKHKPQQDKRDKHQAVYLTLHTNWPLVMSLSRQHPGDSGFPNLHPININVNRMMFTK